MEHPTNDFIDYAECFKGEDGQWYINAKSNNGQVLVTSEGYTRKDDAREAAVKLFPGKQIRER